MTQEAGRGRKQCPQCKNYIGVRNAKCPSCSYEFSIKHSHSPAETKAEASPAVEQKREDDQVIDVLNEAELIAPAGKCPVALTASDEVSVNAWVADIKAHYANKGKTIGAYGVRYLVAKCFDPSTPDYRAVISHLAMTSR